MNNNYYLLCGKESKKKDLASAFAPKETKLAHQLIPELENVCEISFEFELVKLSIGRNGLIKSNDLSSLEEIWLDYQPNSFAWPFFSEKLKSVIEENLTGNEGIDWITAKINGNGEQRIYYIPRFEKGLDVFDLEKCVYNKVTYSVIIPCFSSEKVKLYSVFIRPDDYKITGALYISGALKKAIQKAKCTGVSFEKTRVS